MKNSFINPLAFTFLEFNEICKKYDFTFKSRKFYHFKNNYIIVRLGISVIENDKNTCMAINSQ